MTQIPSLDEPVFEMPVDVLRIENEMTIYQAEALKAQLLAAIRPDEALALDLGQVTEIDSSGVQLLMLAWREAGRLGATVGLAAASDPVQRLLAAFGLDDMITRPAVGGLATEDAAAGEAETEESEAIVAIQAEEANHG